MKFFYIYKLTCSANGKGYVGYTNNIQRRMRQHKATALTGKGQAIHAAIRKYGWDSFVAEELYRAEDKQHVLEKEDYFINLHETKGTKGYNVTRGGQQGPPKGYKRKPMTEEQLVALRKRAKDPEIRRKISEATKGNRNKLGWVASVETRHKQSLAHLGKPGRKFSDQERAQASNRMKSNQHAAGAVPSDEKRKRHSEFMKARDHSYKKGRVLSEETKQKIRTARLRFLYGDQ